MSRSLVARSLEPLVAVLWGVFLIWTIWLAAVWWLGINETWLRLPPAPASGRGWESGAAAIVEDQPLPPHAEFRRAVLLLADRAELIWLALAVVNLHLVVSATNGLGTARAWLGFAAGGAFILGVLNHRTGLPFGWMSFGRALGAQLFGVAAGWLLLWATLVISARESVLWLRPRASHTAVALATAALVLVTMFNLQPVAENVRAWWAWHIGDVRQPAPMRWWAWLTWFAAPWLMAFAMREKSVVAGAARRSVRPLLILALLNLIALGSHFRTWLAP